MNRILLPVRMNCILLLHPDSDHINYTTNHPLIKPRQRNVYISMQKIEIKLIFKLLHAIKSSSEYNTFGEIWAVGESNTIHGRSYIIMEEHFYFLEADFGTEHKSNTMILYVMWKTKIHIHLIFFNFNLYNLKFYLFTCQKLFSIKTLNRNKINSDDSDF